MLLVVRTVLQQIVQSGLVDSAISLGIAAQFGPRVTCACHIRVVLKDFLAETWWRARFTDLRVGALVLDEKKKEISVRKKTSEQESNLKSKLYAKNI